MKNKVKLIIAFILGAIIFGTISAYAMSKYMSKDIGFTPSNSNWHVTNVEDAINDLYSNSKPLIVGEYVSTKQGASAQLSGLLSNIYTNDEYLDYVIVKNEEEYKIVIKKAGNYSINYGLGTLTRQSYQPNCKILLNGQEVDSTTIGTSAWTTDHKELNLDLNVGDEIGVSITGGGNQNTVFLTTITYNGAK